MSCEEPVSKLWLHQMQQRWTWLIWTGELNMKMKKMKIMMIRHKSNNKREVKAWCWWTHYDVTSCTISYLHMFKINDIDKTLSAGSSGYMYIYTDSWCLLPSMFQPSALWTYSHWQVSNLHGAHTLLIRLIIPRIGDSGVAGTLNFQQLSNDSLKVRSNSSVGGGWHTPGIV